MNIVTKDLTPNKLPEIKGISENVRKLAELSPTFKVGDSKAYLSDLFGQEELVRLEVGHSCIFPLDVGTGKSTAMLDIAASSEESEFFFFTNRRLNLAQLKRDYLRKIGMSVSSWSDEAVIGYNTGKIHFSSYQSLAKKGSCHSFPKDSVIVLDEIHYLLNDAAFSSDPMIIRKIIRHNVEHTKRIYISATIDEVLDEIYMIERINPDATELEQVLRNEETSGIHFYINNTFIDQIYLMESSWAHIDLMFYDYSDIDILANYLNKQSENGKKA